MNDDLKQFRLRRGYTMQDVADLSGISTAYYSYIEKGQRRVNYEVAVKIANALKTKPDKLFLNFEKSKCMN
ncbi:helix-turn-helix domain-containing protein [Companilactobacillus mishanensis]|uniref:Helix-turn-helix transcriptional regulator n=1 Tax=Companilactobacillus mishanensis TaxID=2486008 RepID=A0A5P0ZF21_9LACO|nr:helix-turn-helix transcriptional regulator [Companilactobacillus mishanensis]MQS44279.1 helix-turn-helix transcriptional regulator [Companilactobacillus mishanensis]MQS51618.1 helix-turn-helix transcriptional regulator [Companilactobacillus mishanensis]